MNKHTPSPQRVVVPVDVVAACRGEQEHFEAWAKLYRYDMSQHPLHYIFTDPKIDAARMGWKAALAYVHDAAEPLAAAPAPSSLAGGISREQVLAIVRQFASPSWCSVDRLVDTLLAALSPEAPARVPGWPEGMTYGALDDVRSGRGLPPPPRHEAPAELLSNPQEFEAPAEGAGEAYASAKAEIETLLMGETFFSFAEASELATDVMEIVSKHFLRARSSAPEALGNLLAVIHRDGGHRAVEVGVAQAAVEAEKIVANLLSSAPEAREGETCSNGHQPGCDCDVAEEDVARSKPAPSAPSADKLRIAVEALEPFANLGVTSGPDDEPCHYAYRITRGAIRNARQALAALKAEGA